MTNNDDNNNNNENNNKNILQIMCNLSQPYGSFPPFSSVRGPLGPSPLLRSSIMKENKILGYYTFNKVAARNV